MVAVRIFSLLALTVFLIAGLPAQAESPTLDPCKPTSRYCYTTNERSPLLTLYSYSVDYSPAQHSLFLGTLVGVTITQVDVEISAVALVGPYEDPCQDYQVFDDCEANNWFGSPIPVGTTYPYPLDQEDPVAFVYESSFLSIDANGDGTNEFSRTTPIPFVYVDDLTEARP